MNRLIALCIALGLGPNLIAQQPVDSTRSGFASYLFQNELYADLVTLLTNNTELSSQEKFYLGWSYYTQKKLRKSNRYLLAVDAGSDLYEQSRFFSAYNYTYLGQLDSALTLLTSFTPSEAFANLYLFEKAGVELLSRNVTSYRTHTAHIHREDHLIQNELGVLDNIAIEIDEFESKSPWVAGVLSAFVPGLGKIYAGKIGGGISSFLTVGILGALALENYHKDGLNDVKTILFSSMFTLFHIGNIYGSIYAVKDVQHDFNQKVEHRILFHLHIPIRNAFR